MPMTLQKWTTNRIECGGNYLKAEIKKELEITKLQAQTKATLTEWEDLRNCTMRPTVIFKNIPGIQNESWEDTSPLLADFIT